MQLVCPNCSARYLVDPAAIGRQGRTVQCFRCGHKWMAHVDAEPAETTAEPVLTDTRPVPDFVIRPQNHDEQISLPAIPPERGMPLWLKLTLGLVILVGLVGGVGYALRDTLLGAANPPPTNPQPAPTQAPPPTTPLPADALVLAEVRVERVPGAERSMMVTGNIVNTTAGEVTPRRLRFTFKDKDGKAVGEKSVELSPERLPAMGRRPFQQRLDDLPSDSAAVDVAVEPLT